MRPSRVDVSINDRVQTVHMNRSSSYDNNVDYSVGYVFFNDIHLENGQNVINITDHDGALYLRLEFRRAQHNSRGGFELSTLADRSGAYDYDISVSTFHI